MSQPKSPQSTADSTLKELQLASFNAGKLGSDYKYGKNRAEAKTTLATDLKALLPEKRYWAQAAMTPSDYEWNDCLTQVNQIIDKYFGVSND